MDDLPDDASIDGKIKVNLSDLDLLTYQHDLENDINIIEELLAEMNTITPDLDEKLNLLKHVISQKINNQINPNNNKILIFSAFADTVNYIYKHIAPYVKKSFHIESAKVIGSDGAHCTIK